MNGIHVTGTFMPTSNEDTFAVTDELYHRGGYRSVANSVERLAISQERRRVGMLVKEISTGFFYTLSNGILNDNWVQETFGGAGGGSSSEIGTLSLVNADLW